MKPLPTVLPTTLVKMHTKEILKQLNAIENEVSEVYAELIKQRDTTRDTFLYRQAEKRVVRLGTALDSIENIYLLMDET